MTTQYRIDAVDQRGRSLYEHFATIEEAETRAREICARNGTRLFIVETDDWVHRRNVATVSRDSAGRVWTDVQQMQDALL